PAGLQTMAQLRPLESAGERAVEGSWIGLGGILGLVEIPALGQALAQQRDTRAAHAESKLGARPDLGPTSGTLGGAKKRQLFTQRLILRVVRRPRVELAHDRPARCSTLQRSRERETVAPLPPIVVERAGREAAPQQVPASG